MVYKIKALQSAAGDRFSIGKGGIYDVPGQVSEEIAGDLIRGGLAIKLPDTATNKQAEGRETAMRPGKS